MNRFLLLLSLGLLFLPTALAACTLDPEVPVDELEGALIDDAEIVARCPTKDVPCEEGKWAVTCKDGSSYTATAEELKSKRACAR